MSASASAIYTTRATCTKAARLAAYSAGEGEQQPRAPVDEDVARCTSHGSTVLAPPYPVTQSIYLARDGVRLYFNQSGNRWSEGHRWGFVNEVVPADKVMQRAWEVARLIESGPPLVYAAIKQVVREAENMQFLPALKKITGREFDTIDTLYSSEDQLEGALAFTEKRDPIWKGK